MFVGEINDTTRLATLTYTFHDDGLMSRVIEPCLKLVFYLSLVLTITHFAPEFLLSSAHFVPEFYSDVTRFMPDFRRKCTHFFRETSILLHFIAFAIISRKMLVKYTLKLVSDICPTILPKSRPKRKQPAEIQRVVWRGFNLWRRERNYDSNPISYHTLS